VASQAEAKAAVARGTELGYLTPVVGRTFPLAEAAAAHELLVPPAGQAGAGSVGNVVLLP
jgi:NADPH:quinone reductase-like Zn-dependent oxidoreductase